MTPALGFIILGAILLKAGFKNQNIVDVILGRETENPKGKVPSTADILAGIGEGDLGGLTDTPVIPSTDAPSGMPSGTVQFDGVPVAAWIVPQLRWARSHGWKGRVTSGWRDPRRKITPSPGLPVAPQGKSNHNRTTWPGGAVDVTDADGLERVLRSGGPLAPGRSLKRGTAIGDPIHFSATGR